MRKRRVTKNKSKAAILWMWEHTKMIVNCLSVLYVLNWLYSLVVIVVAIKETGQFSYLDTLISETNETFRNQERQIGGVRHGGFNSTP